MLYFLSRFWQHIVLGNANLLWIAFFAINLIIWTINFSITRALCVTVLPQSALVSSGLSHPVLFCRVYHPAWLVTSILNLMSVKKGKPWFRMIVDAV